MAAKFSAKPRDFVPEGAETLDQVRRRVGTFFDSMIDHIGNSFMTVAATLVKPRIILVIKLRIKIVYQPQKRGFTRDKNQPVWLTFLLLVMVELYESYSTT